MGVGPWINQGLVDYWCVDLAGDGDGDGCGQCGYNCPEGTPYCVNGACAECPLKYSAVEDDNVSFGYVCEPDD
jgi:hypothetical protein